MPRSAGKDTTHRVDSRIVPRQQTAQRTSRGSLRQVPYHQHHSEAIQPTDLIDTAEPIEVAEAIGLQLLNRSQPAFRRYFIHNGTRPATWSSTADRASGGGGQPGTYASTATS